MKTKRGNKMQQIKKDADKVVIYLSEDYLKLPKIIQRFAEPHILYNGFYTCKIGDKKVFITR